jgi:hypothetical protein
MLTRHVDRAAPTTTMQRFVFQIYSELKKGNVT